METYFILEIQASNEEAAVMSPPEGYPITGRADRDRALSAFYLKCSYPTTCAKRTLMMVNSNGEIVENCKVTLMQSAVE